MKDQRSVRVSGFFAESTYAGFLEGSVSRMNSAIVESLPNKVEQVFATGQGPKAIAIRFARPTAGKMAKPLPQYLCLVRLTSHPIPNETCDEYTTGSHIVCAFFTDDLDRPVSALVSDHITAFNWAKLAENYGV